MKKRKYQSEALMVLHQHIEALYKLGAITDERMRECDEDCLVSEPEPSRAVRPRKNAAAAKTAVAAPKAAAARVPGKAAISQ